MWSTVVHSFDLKLISKNESIGTLKALHFQFLE